MIPNFFPQDPRDYLRQELDLRQERRPQYSLRAFARDLEMSPSSLCDFLAHRQGLSQERSQLIAKKLGFSEEQREHFWDLIESQFGRTRDDKRAASLRAYRRSREDRCRLSLERFRLVSDWYHLTLLEILSLPNYRPSIADLAQILGVSAEKIEDALCRLEALGLLRLESIQGKRNYQVLTEVTIAGDTEADTAVRLAHQQMLLMQAAAVDRKPMAERESLAISLRIAQKDWDKFRQALKKAMINAASRFESPIESSDQVACLSMQVITLLPHKDQDRA